jgi:hypothetical protein
MHHTNGCIRCVVNQPTNNDTYTPPKVSDGAPRSSGTTPFTTHIDASYQMVTTQSIHHQLFFGTDGFWCRMHIRLTNRFIFFAHAGAIFYAVQTDALTAQARFLAPPTSCRWAAQTPRPGGHRLASRNRGSIFFGGSPDFRWHGYRIARRHSLATPATAVVVAQTRHDNFFGSHRFLPRLSDSPNAHPTEHPTRQLAKRSIHDQQKHTTVASTRYPVGQPLRPDHAASRDLSRRSIKTVLLFVKCSHCAAPGVPDELALFE